jgi:hypothetical protein
MGTLIALLLIVALFVILGAGVWIGIAVLGVAWLGMELFTTRPGGDALALTVWGSLSSWTLTALPLFIWMGEILLKTRLSEGMFRGLAPWLQWLPGRLRTRILVIRTIRWPPRDDQRSPRRSISPLAGRNGLARDYRSRRSWRYADLMRPRLITRSSGRCATGT